MNRFFSMFASLLFISNVYSQDVISEDMSALIKKGNKVFLDIEDKESLSGKYLIDEFNKWGYWTVVEDVQDAQFIISIHIKMSEKKASKLNAESYAEFKTLENQVFKKSRTFAGSPALINGFHAFKGAAMALMNRYFKREFK